MILAFLNIGGQEMMFILIVVLVLFGGKKLPEIARGLGRGIREFKDASEDIKREISDQINNFEKDLDVEVDIDVDAEYDSSNSESQKLVENSEARGEGEAASDTYDEVDEGAGSEVDQEEDPASMIPVFTPAEGAYQHSPGVDGGPNNEYSYGYADEDDPESANSEEGNTATDSDSSKEEIQNAEYSAVNREDRQSDDA